MNGGGAIYLIDPQRVARVSRLDSGNSLPAGGFRPTITNLPSTALGNKVGGRRV